MNILLIVLEIVLRTVDIAKRRMKMSEDRWLFLTLTRAGYTNRRPEESIEIEESEQKRRKK